MTHQKSKAKILIAKLIVVTVFEICLIIWFCNWTLLLANSFLQNGNNSYRRSPEAIWISVCHKVCLGFITEYEISLSVSPHYSFCSRTWALNAVNHPTLPSSEQGSGIVTHPWAKQERTEEPLPTLPSHTFLILRFALGMSNKSVSYWLIFEWTTDFSFSQCISQNWSI